MLIRVLPAKIGDAPSLGWVEIKLEPLMPGAKVVDLEAPMAFIALVTKFSWHFIAAHPFQPSVGSIGPLNNDRLDIGLFVQVSDCVQIGPSKSTYSSGLGPCDAGVCGSKVDCNQELSVRGVISLVKIQIRQSCQRLLRQ